jgi:hypothetical protein
MMVENGGVKENFISVVERAVDKNKAVRIRHLSALDPDIGK